MLTSVTLAGCSAVKPWPTYTGAPEKTTVLTLSNRGVEGLWPVMYEDAEACFGPRYPLLADGRSALIMQPGQKAEMVVERNKPLTIGYTFQTPALGYGGFLVCGGIATFVPTLDRYELIAIQDSGRKRCVLGVTDANGAVQKDVMVAREGVRPFWNSNGPWCEPITETQRARLGVQPASLAPSKPL